MMNTSRFFGIGIAGPEVTAAERDILRKWPPYAVVLFARNITSVEQLQRLCVELKEFGERPPLLMIDEEGGRVDRLREVIPGLPAAESFERVDDDGRLADRFGRILGEALRRLGIDVNLAPVVDLCFDPPAKGLERRCFGADPEVVARYAGAFVRAQQRAGVAACLKHFPGLGRGVDDTHYGAAVIDANEEEMRASDLIPYMRLSNQTRAVMVNHAIYRSLDGSASPATLSRAISTDLLRRVVGFDGVAFSDDMEMHAVADLGSFEENAILSFEAGIDIALYCTQIERLPSLAAHLEERAAIDFGFASRLAEAERRADAFHDFCGKLVAAAPSESRSIEDVRAEAAKLEAEIEARLVASGKSSTPVVENTGSGKTGREEWT